MYHCLWLPYTNKCYVVSLRTTFDGRFCKTVGDGADVTFCGRVFQSHRELISHQSAPRVPFAVLRKNS